MTTPQQTSDQTSHNDAVSNDDPALIRFITAWNSLPLNIQQGIMAIVEGFL